VLRKRNLKAYCGTAIIHLVKVIIVGTGRQPRSCNQDSFGLHFSKDAHEHATQCDQCQRTGSISRRNEMPLQSIIEVEVFDCWGIDFVGPLPPSYGNEYILVFVNYVSKWVKAVAAPKNDDKTVVKLLKKNIFSRFGVPRVLISDGGSHFCNSQLQKKLGHYSITHKVASPYHP